MDSRPDAIRMLSEFLDGPRDEDAFRRFEEWLKEDDDHVRAFYEQLLVEEDIRQLSLLEDVNRYIEGNKESTQQANSVFSRVAEHTSLRSRKWGGALAILATAALILISIVGIFSGAPDSPDQLAEETQVERPLPAEPAIVATLGVADDCQWEEQEEEYSVGHVFLMGSSIHLVSGIASLTFETGATLLVQGPCELKLSDNRIELDRGRVSAVVPRSASGFTVNTPSSEVIDLGTEFGVNVDEFGNSQVHVFSGEVVTRARDSNGEAYGDRMFVTTHKAIHFRPGTLEAERFEADEAAFIRWVGSPAAPSIDDTPPVDGPLLLWLNSGHWVLDEQQHVQVWRDSLSSHNRIPNNALQAIPASRPLVVDDAIGGHPAVRFDGIDDCLITTPMASGDSQTVAFVCSIRGSLCENPQIINYNGPPQYRRFGPPQPAILQIIAGLDDQQRARVAPFAWRGIGNTLEGVHVGRAETTVLESGEFDIPVAGDPFVAVYVYDHEANKAELWINDHSIGSSTAPIPLGLTSRKVVGRHGGHPLYFCGDIAELMIFDEGLDRERVGSLTKQLAEKFSISLSSQPD